MFVKLLRGWLGVALLTLLVTAVLMSGAMWLGGQARVWEWWPGSVTFFGQGHEDTETFAKLVPVGTTGTLRLVNVTGRVTVETGPAGQLEVSAIKRARGTSRYTHQVLEQIEIKVEVTGSEIRVATEYGTRWPSNSSVDYLVTVPPGFGVRINNVTGTIEVRGNPGPVSINNVTGTVDLDAGQPLPEVSIKVVTGRINARFVPVAGGNYNLSTTTGNVAVELPAAAGIEARLSVVTGRITPGPGPWEIQLVDNRRFEGSAAGGGARVTASTVTGSVTLERR